MSSPPRMVSQDNSQALIKHSSDNALMPPPPPSKRIKRPAKVLDEDVYTDALSHIIARDFFPGLLETQAQQEYLDAVDSKDKSWISSAGHRLKEAMTPGPDGRRAGRRGVSMTPLRTPAGETPIGYGGATPMSVAGSDISTTTNATGRPRDIDTAQLSLGQFQQKYTSEDNESFYKLLDKQNQKKREQNAWLWNNNKIPAPRQIAQHEQQQKLLTDSSDDSQKQLITTDLSARPAKPDAWVYRPDNNFMFEPGSVEDSLETIQQRAEASSKAGPKAIVYNNTRIRPIEKESIDSDDTASVSAVRDAIAGRPRLSASEMGSSVGGNETPRINGYAFVDEDEPDQKPEASEYDFSNLLPAADSTPNPFKILDTRKREDLHHRMVDKVAKSKRVEKVYRETKTPIPKFASSPIITKGVMTPGRAGASGVGLTPAAHRLLQSVGKTPIRKSGPSGGSSDEWTPRATPRRKK